MSPGVYGARELSFLGQDRKFMAGHLSIDLRNLRGERIPTCAGIDDEARDLRLRLQRRAKGLNLSLDFRRRSADERAHMLVQDFEERLLIIQ